MKWSYWKIYINKQFMILIFIITRTKKCRKVDENTWIQLKHKSVLTSHGNCGCYWRYCCLCHFPLRAFYIAVRVGCTLLGLVVIRVSFITTHRKRVLMSVTCVKCSTIKITGVCSSILWVQTRICKRSTRTDAWKWNNVIFSIEHIKFRKYITESLRFKY